MQNLSCALKDEQVLIRPRGGNGDSQGKKKATPEGPKLREVMAGFRK